jgi:hypothetical protein
VAAGDAIAERRASVAAEIEPWQAEEEVEGRVYERLYGPRRRSR